MLPSARVVLSLMIASALAGCGEEEQGGGVMDPPGSSGAPSFVESWGGVEDQRMRIVGPQVIAVHTSGTIYLGGAGEHHSIDPYGYVQEFDSEGAWLATWDTEGSIEGTHNRVEGIALDSTGLVYVNTASRIEVLDSDRGHVRSWPLPHGGSGITVVDDVVFVATSMPRQISRFTLDGAELDPIPLHEPPSSGMRGVSDVAIDGNGHLYAADFTEGRIEKFTSDGDFIEYWRFVLPEAIETDSEGHLFVLGANRVSKMSAEGEILASWGANGMGDGEFRAAVDLAAGPDGTIWVCDRFNWTLQAFDSNGSFLSRLGGDWMAAGFLRTPSGVDVGGGLVYVADFSNLRVQVFDLEGRPVTFFDAEGQLESPVDLALSADRVLVPSYGRVFEMTLGGHLVNRWEPGSDGIRSLAVDGEDNVYVGLRSRVEKYGPDRVLITSWDSHGREGGDSPLVVSVHVGPSGRVWVGTLSFEDPGLNVQVFTSSGDFLAAWGELAEPQSWSAGGIAIGSDGTVHVVNARDRRVEMFTEEGEHLGHWGNPGPAAAPMMRPNSVSIDEQGCFFVSDSDGRVHKWE